VARRHAPASVARYAARPCRGARPPDSPSTRHPARSVCPIRVRARPPQDQPMRSPTGRRAATPAPSRARRAGSISARRRRSAAEFERAVRASPRRLAQLVDPLDLGVTPDRSGRAANRPIGVAFLLRRTDAGDVEHAPRRAAPSPGRSMANSAAAARAAAAGCDHVLRRAAWRLAPLAVERRTSAIRIAT
jgi:hypothetical protein